MNVVRMSLCIRAVLTLLLVIISLNIINCTYVVGVFFFFCNCKEKIAVGDGRVNAVSFVSILGWPSPSW